MVCVIWFENCTSYCSLNLACSASGSSPFHKKAERKLRVLNCKPSPFLLFLCSSVFNIQPVSLVLLFLCLKKHPVSLVLLSKPILTDKLQLLENELFYSIVCLSRFFLFLL